MKLALLDTPRIEIAQKFTLKEILVDIYIFKVFNIFTKKLKKKSKFQESCGRVENLNNITKFVQTQLRI